MAWLQGLLWGLGLAAAAAAAAGSCLPRAVAPEQRRFLAHEREDIPVGIFLYSWDSAKLLGHLAKVLLGEVLGYQVAFSGQGSASVQGVYAVAGCADPVNYQSDPQCSATPLFKNHLIFEVWGLEKESLFRTRYAHLPHIFPENLGALGYDGVEGIYLFDDVLRGALNTTGDALEYYRSYDPRWHSPWQHFEGRGSIGREPLLDCGDTLLMSVSEVGNYLEQTQDFDGVVKTDAGWVAKCWDEKWWLAPACRAEPQRCIPLITGGAGWGVAQFMQRAFFHSMPLAVAVSSKWSSDCPKHRILQYWWEPDVTFVELEPELLIFPQSDRDELARGIFRTQAAELPLLKYAHRDFKAAASHAHEFASRMQIGLKHMQAMLRKVKALAAADDLHERVACEWLRENSDVWQQWVPKPTDCVPGQGLTGGNGSYVAAGAVGQATGCEWCAPGFRSTMEDGVYLCERCALGQSQGTPGSTQCALCERGRFAERAAAADCERCPAGHFQDTVGSSACRACPAGSTTRFMGAQQASDCVCPEGFFRSSNGVCVACPLGMSCAVGSDAAHFGDRAGPFPLAKAGYMTLPAEPLKVYRCLVQEHCPGGLPASCAPRRDATKVACGTCVEGAFEDGNHCEPCEDADIVPGLVMMVAGVLGILGGVSWMVGRSGTEKIDSGGVQSLLLGSTVITSLQTLTVFGQLSFSWPPFVQGALKAVGVLSFDLQGLRLGCVVNTDVAMWYAYQQLMAPCCMLLVAAAVCGRLRLAPQMKGSMLDEALNAVGTVFSVCFISILVACVAPLVCYRHPDNETSSMRASPSTLCWEGGDHTTMVAVCLFIFATVILPFVAAVVWATLQQPHWTRDAGRSRHLIASRFLFMKFRPRCYFYSLLFLLRSMVITMVPIFFVNPAVQAVILCSALVVFIMVQVRLRPWRSVPANAMDAALSACLLMMLVIGVAASDGDVDQGVLDALAAGSLVAVLASCALALVLALVLFRFRTKVKYPWFICHCKADAAAQARFFKLSLKSRAGSDVFVDSDDLCDLDDLFSIVKEHVGTLVVYLTATTLRRPWCAGEILSAAESPRTKLAAVRAPSFAAPAQEHMDDLSTYIDQSDCILAQYGMSTDRVRAAYEKLLHSSTPTAHVGGHRGTAKFEQAIVSLLQWGSPRRSVVKARRSPTSRKLCVSTAEGTAFVISLHSEDDEAVASGGILQAKLAQSANLDVKSRIYLMSDWDLSDLDAVAELTDSAHAVIVLLSQGTMRSQQQLLVMAQAATTRRAEQAAIVEALSTSSSPRHVRTNVAQTWSSRSPFSKGSDQVRKVIIPLMLSGFVFPDSAFYAGELRRMFPSCADEIADLLRSFFKLIALPFSTNASDQVIEAQAGDVAARLPRPGALGRLCHQAELPTSFFIDLMAVDGGNGEAMTPRQGVRQSVIALEDNGGASSEDEGSNDDEGSTYSA